MFFETVIQDLPAFWILLTLALYAAAALAFVLPALLATLRAALHGRDGAPALFVGLALIAAIYAFPSSAEKGGPPPPPDAPPGPYILNLRFDAASGRYVPRGWAIRQETAP
jgi:hypothetical protein